MRVKRIFGVEGCPGCVVAKERWPDAEFVDMEGDHSPIDAIEAGICDAMSLSEMNNGELPVLMDDKERYRLLSEVQ